MQNDFARDVAPLFEPLRIKQTELKNRIVMAPMTRSASPGGMLTDDMIAYYRRRAEGGAGLILTEGVPVDLIGARSHLVPYFFGEEELARWKLCVDEVHAAGGKIMPQLWHVGLGRRLDSEATDEPAVGADATYPRKLTIEEDASFVDGRAMTQADIDACIDAFATAAVNAQKIGADGVELHGGHGYLFDQFFWDKTNHRTDKYGGDIAGRTRFTVETVQEMRRRVGPDFPIGLRYSQWKMLGYYDAKLVETPQELEKFLNPLVDAGVDFFDCSTRRYWETEFPGSDLTLAGWTKKITGKITMTIGSVGLAGPLSATLKGILEGIGTDNNLDRLLDMFNRGDFDLVGVGRAILANPSWPDKVRKGEVDDLVGYTIDAAQKVY